MSYVRPGWISRSAAIAVTIALAAVSLAVSTEASVEPPAAGVHRTGNDLVLRHDETGKVGFLGSPAGKPIETGALRADPPAAVARDFLRGRGEQLGLGGPMTDLEVADQRPLPGGGTVVRLDQTVGGVPVLGGEFVVSLDAGRDVLSVLGEASPIAATSTEPLVAASVARSSAVDSVARETGTPAAQLTSATPELMFYDARLLDAPGPFQTARLSWVLEVRGGGSAADVSHQVVIDATTGAVALSFATIAAARIRTVCDANNTTTQYPCTTPLRTEVLPPTGADDVDVQKAFEYAGDTYDFYFDRFGRDSLDGNGMPLVSTADWCPSSSVTDCPYKNAFWDGRQMVYGDGFASADDVVGHELSHGVTDFSSSLFYYQQSGAINEAMSDIFGELIDLTNGVGTDTAGVRWLVGEDIPGFGAIRDMENPPAFGDPDRMRSPSYQADPNERDQGGVHSNSGVANKAAYLTTDGGTFNGQSITGLGITKAARLFYTVNTALLVSGSDYADLANALRQGCRNLAGTGTDGFTTADCAEVDKVVLATEMDLVPTAAPTTTASICPNASTVTSTQLADNLETDTGQLSPTPIVGPDAWYYPQNPNPYFDATYATSGSTNVWGDDTGTISDSAIRMTRPVTIPTGAYLHFKHAYGFDDDASGTYDGGVVEYSTSGAGGPWVDAGSLFTASGGAGGYTGSISSGHTPTNPRANPLVGRAAFVRESFGYGASRADLSSLAGQSVLFRWRIGTDDAAGDYGWFIDDVSISTCAAPVAPSTPPPTTTSTPDPIPTTTSTPAPTTPTTAPPTTAPVPTSAPTSSAPTSAPDTTSPQTSITKGPRKLTARARAGFRFVSESGARFRCQLDHKRWRSCTSPTRLRVGSGRHTFKVVAIDAAGNVDPTPAKRSWRVRA